MKTFVAIEIPLAVLCLAITARAADLILNGGFEEMQTSNFLRRLDSNTKELYGGTADSPLEGWAFGGHWEKGDYSIAVSSEAHAGKHSCQITCRRKGRGGIASVPLRLKAGTIIQVSVWLKARDATGGRVFLNFEGTPGDGWTSKDLRTGTYDWTRFTKRAVIPAVRRAAIRRSSCSCIRLAKGQSGWMISRSSWLMSTRWPKRPTNRPPPRKPLGPCPSPAIRRGIA